MAVAAMGASAQSAFTVESKGATYSFGIDSKITLTNNPLWTPDTVYLRPDTASVKPKYKSAFKSVRLNFESHFSTSLQKNTTGVDTVYSSRLIADSLWAVSFKVNDYRRVVFGAYAEDSVAGVSNRIACKQDNFAQASGSVEFDKKGLGYKMMNYGTNGDWTFLFNEKLMQFALINTINGSPNLAIMKDTVLQKIDYSKIIDIDNVSDTWYAEGNFNGTVQKIPLKLTADPVTNRAMEKDGIAYSINGGRTRIKFPITLPDSDIEFFGYFPDEYDFVAYDSVPDFKVSNTATVAETYGFYVTQSDDALTTAPTIAYLNSVSSNTISLTVLDGNRFRFDNGLIMCKYTLQNGAKVITDYMKIIPGSILYRDSCYPTAAATDTVYVTKTDTVKVYLASASVEDIIAAGNAVDEQINTTSGTYNLTESQLSYYASLYKLGKITDTSSLSADSVKLFEEALDNLRKASLSYTYLTQKLMDPALIGKYLCLGQGNVAYGMLFNKKAEITASTYTNGYIMGNGSGYVAYAKLNVAKGDSTLFVPSTAGKTFETATMMGAKTFGGIDTIDVFVIYNPNLDAYVPIYVAKNGNTISEQWKGNTKNNYPTLEEAIAHFGPSSMNMADRFWCAADYDEDGARVQVVNGAASIDDLYSKYSDFTVVRTYGGTSAKQLLEDGVTIDTSKTPFTYTKNGESCDFSGVAVLKAKDADGDNYIIAVMLSGKKYYVYAYLLNE